jgi:hypothetical protein
MLGVLLLDCRDADPHAIRTWTAAAANPSWLNEHLSVPIPTHIDTHFSHLEICSVPAPGKGSGSFASINQEAGILGLREMGRVARFYTPEVMSGGCHYTPAHVQPRLVAGLRLPLLPSPVHTANNNKRNMLYFAR